jgi:hypothetical protein
MTQSQGRWELAEARHPARDLIRIELVPVEDGPVLTTVYRGEMDQLDLKHAVRWVLERDHPSELRAALRKVYELLCPLNRTRFIMTIPCSVAEDLLASVPELVDPSQE